MRIPFVRPSVDCNEAAAEKANQAHVGIQLGIEENDQRKPCNMHGGVESTDQFELSACAHMPRSNDSNCFMLTHVHQHKEQDAARVRTIFSQETQTRNLSVSRSGSACLGPPSQRPG